MLMGRRWVAMKGCVGGGTVGAWMGGVGCVRGGRFREVDRGQGVDH